MIKVPLTVIATQNTKTKEILDLTNTRTTLKQNNIQFNNHLYNQHAGLAMGAHPSAILAEIFIQFLEYNNS
jgi:hypothetical protein